ncbi:hypothetical protein, partial [Pyxidicoccus fallax]
MRRHRLLIVLLALGTVGGYASGFASLARRHHHHRCHTGAWGERWDSRWDSRGHPGSWEPHGYRGDDAPPARFTS